MKTFSSLAFAAALTLAACADMSETEQRTLSGAAIGTGTGAVIGAIAGNAGLGAAIGAVGGAAGGYIWDRHKQTEQQSYERGFSEGQASRPR
jgi:hypothetical protein